MNNRSLLILEIIWTVTGILCLAAGARLFILSGYNNRLLVFLLMAIISFLFALYRHRQRKK